MSEDVPRGLHVSLPSLATAQSSGSPFEQCLEHCGRSRKQSHRFLQHEWTSRRASAILVYRPGPNNATATGIFREFEERGLRKNAGTADPSRAPRAFLSKYELDGHRGAIGAASRLKTRRPSNRATTTISGFLARRETPPNHALSLHLFSLTGLIPPWPAHWKTRWAVSRFSAHRPSREIAPDVPRAAGFRFDYSVHPGKQSWADIGPH